MKRAVFVVGFNNWGKSTVIYELFGKKRFSFGKLHPLATGMGTGKFTVESHSNDDLNLKNYLKLLKKRIKLSPDKGQNLFTALCPTIEKKIFF